MWNIQQLHYEYMYYYGQHSPDFVVLYLILLPSFWLSRPKPIVVHWHRKFCHLRANMKVDAHV